MRVCARAPCKYESNFPVFFLPLSLRRRRRRRRPRGSGRPAAVEVGGPGRGQSWGGGGGLWELVSHSWRLGWGENSGERGLDVWGAGSDSRRPLAGDICPGSQPGGERARCGGQVPRPAATGARARGGRLPGYCAPADFHGRLPQSRWRRPGAGLSPGFKRHSRNVNNPGGSAPGQSARVPHPSLGDSLTAGPPGPPPLPAANFFFLCFPSHLAPPAGYRARASL